MILMDIMTNIASAIYNEKYYLTDGGYPSSSEIIESFYNLASDEEIKQFSAEDIKKAAAAAAYEI